MGMLGACHPKDPWCDTLPDACAARARLSVASSGLSNPATPVQSLSRLSHDRPLTATGLLQGREARHGRGSAVRGQVVSVIPEPVREAQVGSTHDRCTHSRARLPRPRGLGGPVAKSAWKTCATIGMQENGVAPSPAQNGRIETRACAFFHAGRTVRLPSACWGERPPDVCACRARGVA